MRRDRFENFRERLSSLLAQLDRNTIGSMEYAGVMQQVDSLVSAHLLDAITALEQREDASAAAEHDAND